MLGLCKLIFGLEILAMIWMTWFNMSNPTVRSCAAFHGRWDILNAQCIKYPKNTQVLFKVEHR